MNLGEFKAWFEGFSEGIKDRPTKKQWERIQERVSEIVSEATPYPVFVDRYIPSYLNWPWPYRPAWNGNVALGAQSNNVACAANTGNFISTTAYVADTSGEQMTPTAMFVELGRADLAAIN